MQDHPHDDQILVPDSFLALYRDERGRPGIDRATLLERYDLCEDLANQLVELAGNVHHGLGVAEDEVLARCRRGLEAVDSPVSTREAAWVERRLAELMGWA